MFKLVTVRDAGGSFEDQLKASGTIPSGAIVVGGSGRRLTDSQISTPTRPSWLWRHVLGGPTFEKRFFVLHAALESHTRCDEYLILLQDYAGSSRGRRALKGLYNVVRSGRAVPHQLAMLCIDVLKDDTLSRSCDWHALRQPLEQFFLRARHDIIAYLDSGMNESKKVKSLSIDIIGDILLLMSDHDRDRHLRDLLNVWREVEQEAVREVESEKWNHIRNLDSLERKPLSDGLPTAMVLARSKQQYFESLFLKMCNNRELVNRFGDYVRREDERNEWYDYDSRAVEWLRNLVKTTLKIRQ